MSTQCLVSNSVVEEKLVLGCVNIKSGVCEEGLLLSLTCCMLVGGDTHYLCFLCFHKMHLFRVSWLSETKKPGNIFYSYLSIMHLNLCTTNQEAWMRKADLLVYCFLPHSAAGHYVNCATVLNLSHPGQEEGRFYLDNTNSAVVRLPQQLSRHFSAAVRLAAQLHGVKEASARPQLWCRAPSVHADYLLKGEGRIL